MLVWRRANPKKKALPVEPYRPLSFLSNSPIARRPAVNGSSCLKQCIRISSRGDTAPNMPGSRAKTTLGGLGYREGLEFSTLGSLGWVYLYNTESRTLGLHTATQFWKVLLIVWMLSVRCWVSGSSRKSMGVNNVASRG